MASSKGLGADPAYRRLIDLAQVTGDMDLVRGMEHLSHNSRLDKNFVIYESTSKVGRAAFHALGLPRSGITVRQALVEAGAYAASRHGRGYREFAEALTRYLGIAEGLTSADVGTAAPAEKVGPDEGSLYAAGLGGTKATGDPPVEVGSVEADVSALGDVGGAPHEECQITPQDEATVFSHNPDLIDLGDGCAHGDTGSPQRLRSKSLTSMSTSATPAVDRLAALIPDELMDLPGHAFYSGEAAFAGRSRLYLLAENPGSDGLETVRQQLHNLRNGPSSYSAFATHTWKPAGRVDHSVLHLLRRLSLNPTEVPASCLIFSRTRGESDLAGSFDRLADLCWPFHQAVVDNLDVDVIVCFGKKTGAYVRTRFDAHEQIDQFVEQNNRGWTSHTHLGRDGLKVVSVTHPSRVDWRNPAADVSPLVARALNGN